MEPTNEEVINEHFSAGFDAGYQKAIDDMKQALEKLQEKKHD